jgi:rare lipoprotein A
VIEQVWLRRSRRGAVGLVIGAAFAIVACSRSSTGPGPSGEGRIDPRTGTSASPRLYGEGQPIPGGGTYKLGSPIDGTVGTCQPRNRYDKAGLASWYGSDFHGRKTSNGEVFDMNALTAAHPTLPLPSYAYVTNLSNNRTILVRINDRGPYANDRIVDLSRRSARELGFELHGLTRVRVKYAGRAPLNGNDIHEQRFLAGMRRGPIAAAPSAPYVQTAERAYPAPSQSAASQIPSGLTWRR